MSDFVSIFSLSLALSLSHYHHREDYIAVTARDIFSKIPLASMDIGTYDPLQTRAKLLLRNGTDIISPCQVVLLQELERWNNLVKRMASSLADLQRALVGKSHIIIIIIIAIIIIIIIAIIIFIIIIITLVI